MDLTPKIGIPWIVTQQASRKQGKNAIRCNRNSYIPNTSMLSIQYHRRDAITKAHTIARPKRKRHRNFCYRCTR